MNSDNAIAEASPQSAPLPEPVLATIIPPPPSPWQFGLKAMLGLMAVCSVQFAIMSYVGVLWGLVLGIATCFTILAGVLFTAVCLVSGRSPLMERLDFIGIRLVVGITVLFLGTIIAGGGTGVYYYINETRTALQLEADLGIRTLRTQVYDAANPRTYNGLRLVLIIPAGVADRGGMRRDEVIYFEGTTSEFFHMLEQNRGKPVTLNVASGTSTNSLDKCPKRQITLTVPN